MALPSRPLGQPAGPIKPPSFTRKFNVPKALSVLPSDPLRHRVDDYQREAVLDQRNTEAMAEAENQAAAIRAEDAMRRRKEAQDRAEQEAKLREQALKDQQAQRGFEQEKVYKAQGRDYARNPVTGMPEPIEDDAAFESRKKAEGAEKRRKELEEQAKAAEEALKLRRESIPTLGVVDRRNLEGMVQKDREALAGVTGDEAAGQRWMTGQETEEDRKVMRGVRPDLFKNWDTLEEDTKRQAEAAKLDEEGRRARLRAIGGEEWEKEEAKRIQSLDDETLVKELEALTERGKAVAKESESAWKPVEERLAASQAKVDELFLRADEAVKAGHPVGDLVDMGDGRRVPSAIAREIEAESQAVQAQMGARGELLGRVETDNEVLQGINRDAERVRNELIRRDRERMKGAAESLKQQGGADVIDEVGRVYGEAEKLLAEGKGEEAGKLFDDLRAKVVSGLDERAAKQEQAFRIAGELMGDLEKQGGLDQGEVRVGKDLSVPGFLMDAVNLLSGKAVTTEGLKSVAEGVVWRDKEEAYANERWKQAREQAKQAGLSEKEFLDAWKDLRALSWKDQNQKDLYTKLTNGGYAFNPARVYETEEVLATVPEGEREKAKAWLEASQQAHSKVLATELSKHSDLYAEFDATEGATLVEKARNFKRKVNENPRLSKLGSGLGQWAAGLSGSMVNPLNWFGGKHAEASKLREQAYGAYGNAVDGYELYGLLAQTAGSFVESYATGVLTGGLGMVAGAFKKGADLAKWGSRFGMGGVGVEVGLRSGEQTFEQALQAYQAMGDPDASKKALGVATASGLIAMLATMSGGPRGGEAVLRTFSSNGFRNAAKGYVRAIFGDVKEEIVEEALKDQLPNALLAAWTYQPNMTLTELGQQLKDAGIGGLFGGFAGGVMAARGERKERVQVAKVADELAGMGVKGDGMARMAAVHAAKRWGGGEVNEQKAREIWEGMGREPDGLSLWRKSGGSVDMPVEFTGALGAAVALENSRSGGKEPVVIDSGVVELGDKFVEAVLKGGKDVSIVHDAVGEPLEVGRLLGESDVDIDAEVGRMIAVESAIDKAIEKGKGKVAVFGRDGKMVRRGKDLEMVRRVAKMAHATRADREIEAFQGGEGIDPATVQATKDVVGAALTVAMGATETLTAAEKAALETELPGGGKRVDVGPDGGIVLTDGFRQNLAKDFPAVAKAIDYFTGSTSEAGEKAGVAEKLRQQEHGEGEGVDTGEDTGKGVANDPGANVEAGKGEGVVGGEWVAKTRSGKELRVPVGQAKSKAEAERVLAGMAERNDMLDRGSVRKVEGVEAEKQPEPAKAEAKPEAKQPEPKEQLDPGARDLRGRVEKVASKFKGLNVRFAPLDGVHAMSADANTDTITIDIDALDKQAKAAGLEGKKAEKYVEDAFMEEVIHIAQARVARAKWEQAGSKGDFAEFMQSYYRMLWNDGFTAEGKEKVISLYFMRDYSPEERAKRLETLKKGGLPEGVSHYSAASEGIRMLASMARDGKLTEDWQAEVLKNRKGMLGHLKELLKQIKAMLVGEVDARVKAEVDAIQRLIDDMEGKGTAKPATQGLLYNESGEQGVTTNPERVNKSGDKIPARKPSKEGLNIIERSRVIKKSDFKGEIVDSTKDTFPPAPEDTRSDSERRGEVLDTAKKANEGKTETTEKSPLETVGFKGEGKPKTVDEAKARVAEQAATTELREALAAESGKKTPLQEARQKWQESLGELTPAETTAVGDILRHDYERFLELIDNGKVSKERVAELIRSAARAKALDGKVASDFLRKLEKVELDPVALKQIQDDYDAAIRMANQEGISKERSDAIKKAAGMKRAAAMRELTGKLTAKEQEAKEKREKSNYTGKKVFANGRGGVVRNVSFGKVTVDFPDGTSGRFNPSEVVAKTEKKTEPEPSPAPKQEEAENENDKLVEEFKDSLREDRRNEKENWATLPIAEQPFAFWAANEARKRGIGFNELSYEEIAEYRRMHDNARSAAKALRKPFRPKSPDEGVPKGYKEVDGVFVPVSQETPAPQAEALPQPTKADWMARDKFVGEHFAGPPNSVVVQPRDLDAVPIGKHIVLPLQDSMEETVRMVESGYRDAIGNGSLRESVVTVIGPDGRAVAQMSFDGMTGKMLVADQKALEGARERLREMQEARSNPDSDLQAQWEASEAFQAAERAAEEGDMDRAEKIEEQWFKDARKKAEEPAKPRKPKEKKELLPARREANTEGLESAIRDEIAKLPEAARKYWTDARVNAAVEWVGNDRKGDVDLTGPAKGLVNRAQDVMDALKAMVDEVLPEQAPTDDLSPAERKLKKGLEGLFAKPLTGYDTPAPFYSQLARTIEQKMPSTARPEQVMGIAMGGAKPEEVKWSGLATWLQGKDKVSKAEVLDWLANEGAVRFEEVTLGTMAKGPDPVPAFARRMQEKYGERWIARMTPEESAEYDAAIDATPNVTPTKFSQYQLPGGENYREVVLAMPVKADPADISKWTATRNTGRRLPWAGAPEPIEVWEIRDSDGGYVRNLPVAQFPTAEAALARSAEMYNTRDEQGRRSTEYTSSHFPDVPNYVAHMRLNDRVDANGKPGLFIEEIQSDRHQEGRKKGYRGDFSDSLPDKWKTVQTPTGFWVVENEQGVRVSIQSPNKEEAIQDALKATTNGLIPDAPYRTTWPLALFKRALRDAVAGGKSWIGWTTGETQNDRFDLSKQVDAVQLRKKNGLFTIYAKPVGRAVESAEKIAENVPAEKVEDYIGKDLARKAGLDDFRDGESLTLEGADLKVGGSGMKGFYDTILPKEIGKYVKQWGGKVEKAKIEDLSNLKKYVSSYSAWLEYIDPDGLTSREEFDAMSEADKLAAVPREGDFEATPIWRVDITPAMRSGVEQGQALFAKPLYVPQVYDKPLPADRLPILVGVAQELIAEGIDTPAKLAESMRKIAPDNKAVPLTQSIWFLMKSVGAKGEAEPDWDAVYGGMEGATAEAGQTVSQPEVTTVEAPKAETKEAKETARKPNTDIKKMKAQKEYLLAALDKAIKEAPYQTVGGFKLSEEGEQDMKQADKTRFSQDELTRIKLHEKYGVPVHGNVFDEINQRPLRDAISARHYIVPAADKIIEIEVPGDGVFRVVNNKPTLQEFRKDVAARFPSIVPKRHEYKSPTKNPTAITQVGTPKSNQDYLKAAAAFTSDDPSRLAINDIISDGENVVATNGRTIIAISHDAGGTKEKPLRYSAKDQKPIDPKEREGLAMPDWKARFPKTKGKEFGIDTATVLKIAIQARTMVEDTKAVYVWEDAEGKVGYTLNDPATGTFSGGDANPETARRMAVLDVNYMIDAMKSLRALGHEKATMEIFQEGEFPLALFKAPWVKILVGGMKVRGNETGFHPLSEAWAKSQAQPAKEPAKAENTPAPVEPTPEPQSKPSGFREQSDTIYAGYTPQQLLEKARKHTEYGQNYNRNIADSYKRLKQVLDRGEDNYVQMNADELAVRLELYGDKEPEAQPQEGQQKEAEARIKRADKKIKEITEQAQTPAQNAPSFYVNGDRAEYTGETREIAGGTFYVGKIVEGNKIGQEAVTQKRPDGTSPNDGKAKQAWKKQQEEFSRLNKPPQETPPEPGTPEFQSLPPEQKREVASPPAIDSVKSLLAFNNLLLDGNVTADQVKAAWEQFKTNEGAIKGEVSKMTMKELERFRGIRKPDNKADAVEMAMDALEGIFNPGSMLSYGGVIGQANMEQAKRNAMEKAVSEWTDETIQKQAQERRDAKAAREKALENPETLEEWKQFVRRKGVTGLTPEETKELNGIRDPWKLEARIMSRGESRLTPEQLAAYDSVRGIDRKEKAREEAERKATVRGVNAGTESEIVETKHTKTGEDLFVVRLADRVERDVYNNLNNAAKKLGGWYSSYRGGGAVPGFQFKTRENAEQFQAITRGETVSRADSLNERKDAMKSATAERLVALADKMDVAADKILNAERQTNTARRARMAAYAESEANGMKSMAETMRNVAAAIESGEAVHLDGIKTRTHIETLDSLVRRAQRKAWQEEKLSYADEMKRKGESPTPDQMAKAQYPWPFLNADALKWLVENGNNTPGAKRLVVRIERVLNAKPEVKANGGYIIDRDGDGIISVVKGLLERINRQDYTRKYIEGAFSDYDRLQAMGLKDLVQLRAALREYLQFRGKKRNADPLKAMERELVGMKMPGFFPTPQTVIEQMLDQAGDLSGKHVLEPSGGKGDIADAARAAGAMVDVAETQGRLRDILTAKKHNVIGDDFLSLSPDTRGFTYGDVFQAPDGKTGIMRGLGEMGSDRVRLETEGGETIGYYNASELQGVEKRGSNSGYDVVLMNPPFEDGQDAVHVQHAYKFLKPGGKMVAIMGEGVFGRSDKKSQEFREWLEAVGGVSEKLPEGSFKSAFRPTGVNTRIVTIDKGTALFAKPLSESDAEFQRQLTRLRSRIKLPPQGEKAIRDAIQDAIDLGKPKPAGNPDLANISGDEAVRAEMDVTDAIREYNRTVQKFDDWQQEASRVLARDGELHWKKYLMDKALEGDSKSDNAGVLTAVDTIIAKKLAADLTQRALISKDRKLMREAALVRYAYREARGDVGRALAAGRDLFQSVEERRASYLIDAILQPTNRVEKMAKKLPPGERKSFIQKETEKRLAKIEAELLKMGVTLQDIFDNKAYLMLKTSNIWKQVAETFNPTERIALEMMQRHIDPREIARQTGYSFRQLDELRQEGRKRAMEAFKPYAKRGLTIENMERIQDSGTAMKARPLDPAENDALTPEQLRELERMVDIGLGFDSYFNAENGKPDTPFRAPAATGVPKTSPVQKPEGKRKSKQPKEEPARPWWPRPYRMKQGQAFAYRFDISNAIHFKKLAKAVHTIEGDYIDKAKELWYSNILSGPLTLLVNLSSVPYAAWEMVVTRFMRRFMFGGKDVVKGEFKHLFEGFAPGIARAWSNAVATWKAESGFFEEDVLGEEPAEVDSDHRGLYKTGYIKGEKGRWLRWAPRLLLATDDFMKTLIAQMEVGTQAHRMGTKMGLSGEELSKFITAEINLPGSPSWVAAAERAEKLTFTNRLPGKKEHDTLADFAGYVAKTIGEKVRGDESDNKVMKFFKAVISLFFPFVRTPFNILRSGLDYSPIFGTIELLTKVGVNSTFENGKFKFNPTKDPEVAEDVGDLVAKQFMGALLLMILAEAAEGDDDDAKKWLLITGTQDPLDKTARERGYRTVPAMSIKIGDKSYSYARIDPFAISIATTVDLLRSFKRVGHGAVASDVSSIMIASLLHQLSDKSYARGFEEISRLMDGQGNLPDWAGRQAVSMLVPNLIRQPLRNMDPYYREVTRKDKGAKDWLYEALPMGGMPWTPPASVDIYGRPAKKGGTMLSRLVDVTKSRPVEIHKLDRMEQNFINQNPDYKKQVSLVGEVSGEWVDPLIPPTNKQRNKKMTPAQLSKFNEVAGRILQTEVMKYPWNVEKPTVKDMENKRNAINTARDKARTLLYRDPKWRNLK